MTDPNRDWHTSWSLVGQTTPPEAGRPLRVLLVRDGANIVVDLVRSVAHGPFVGPIDPQMWMVFDELRTIEVREALSAVAEPAAEKPAAAAAAAPRLSPKAATRLARVEATPAALKARRSAVDAAQATVAEAAATSEDAPTIDVLVDALRRGRPSLNVVVYWGKGAEDHKVLNRLCKWTETDRRIKRPLLDSGDSFVYLVNDAYDQNTVNDFRWKGDMVRRFQKLEALDVFLPRPPAVEVKVNLRSHRNRKFLQHSDCDLVYVTGSTRPHDLPRDAWTSRASCVIFESRGEHSAQLIASASKVRNHQSVFLSDALSDRVWQMFTASPRINDLVQCLRLLFNKMQKKYDLEIGMQECQTFLRSVAAGSLGATGWDELVEAIESDPMLRVLDVPPVQQSMLSPHTSGSIAGQQVG